MKCQFLTLAVVLAARLARQDEAQQNTQPPNQEAEVVAGPRGEDGVIGVAAGLLVIDLHGLRNGNGL